MELFTLPGQAEGVLRAIYSFFPPAVETEHMVKDANGNMIIDTKGDVLLGKMGFKLLNDEGTYDITKFALVEDTENAPQTGININMDGIFATNSHYEAQSTFRFTEGNQDLSLANITVSHTDKIDEVPDETTYKEYTLTPTFSPETLEYETTILEYIDDIDIKVKKSDEKSKLKIKVPKKDENGKLIYEDDGTTIVYEEKELIDDTPTNVILNKLGEPDTKIIIVVESEDESAKNEYIVNIKRPYGTIQGSVQLGSELREVTEANYGNIVQYIANATVYKSGEFNWDGIVPEEASLYELEDLELQAQVETDGNDGSYRLYVIPGKYDLILERIGFLAHVVKGITVNENDVIEIDNKILIEGDIDRSGVISLADIVEVVDRLDTSDGDGIYDSKCDFGQKGFIALADIVSVVDNMDMLINIEEYV